MVQLFDVYEMLVLQLVVGFKNEQIILIFIGPFTLAICKNELAFLVLGSQLASFC
jgi:hypothetical protein